MSYSDEIKKIRKKCFLSQEAFGREIGVSFSSIKRWEGGKSKPNMAAMKKLKDFCDIHGIDSVSYTHLLRMLPMMKSVR